MKCPVCREITLTMAERQGVDIDYCSQCRGVWLDRGELENLLRRAERGLPARSVHPAEYRYGGEPQRREAEQRYYGKRKSWLAGIFD
jgi:Zn-finger nucleic acid-binding protein